MMASLDVCELHKPQAIGSVEESIVTLREPSRAALLYSPGFTHTSPL